MIKYVDLLVREDGVTHEEFVDWWLGEHSDLAKELPGLQKYVTSVPTDPEAADYDGVLELYFEDTAAMGAAFDSEIGQDVMADAADYVDQDAGPSMICEETVQLDRLD